MQLEALLASLRVHRFVDIEVDDVGVEQSLKFGVILLCSWIGQLVSGDAVMQTLFSVGFTIGCRARLERSPGFL